MLETAVDIIYYSSNRYGNNNDSDIRGAKGQY